VPPAVGFSPERPAQRGPRTACGGLARPQERVPTTRGGPRRSPPSAGYAKRLLVRKRGTSAIRCASDPDPFDRFA